ncbi:uncharacterized protein LOC129961854 [Argiope bruennichi]|uniref:uncharacterized protein LOC129961854 n=1 Tax=Argiope bruennichi TaxID=94029 RepID=UPI002494C9F9|nr:uncharacterized protein LOC129961854 [Argiope bruennichi]
MDIQDEEQDHVAIEMDFLDDGPFADRAQLPALPREGTRQHRIAPDEPVGVLDGRQVRRYVVRGPELRRSERLHSRSRISQDEESNVDDVPTDAQREWYRNREIRRMEDRRAPMSTETKYLVIIWFTLVIVIILFFIPYLIREQSRESSNLNVSLTL